jgi:hypothetical protein
LGYTQTMGRAKRTLAAIDMSGFDSTLGGTRGTIYADGFDWKALKESIVENKSQTVLDSMSKYVRSGRLQGAQLQESVELLQHAYADAPEVLTLFVTGSHLDKEVANIMGRDITDFASGIKLLAISESHELWEALSRFVSEEDVDALPRIEVLTSPEQELDVQALSSANEVRLRKLPLAGHVKNMNEEQLAGIWRYLNYAYRTQKISSSNPLLGAMYVRVDNDPRAGMEQAAGAITRLLQSQIGNKDFTEGFTLVALLNTTLRELRDEGEAARACAMRRAIDEPLQKQALQGHRSLLKLREIIAEDGEQALAASVDGFAAKLQLIVPQERMLRLYNLLEKYYTDDHTATESEFAGNVSKWTHKAMAASTVDVLIEQPGYIDANHPLYRYTKQGGSSTPWELWRKEIQEEIEQVAKTNAATALAEVAPSGQQILSVLDNIVAQSS